MRILLSIVFLCLCIATQAQKKNEIQIGIPSAYFFDDTPYSFHNFKHGEPFPTHISYTRFLTEKSALSISFNSMWLVYDFTDNNYHNEVLLRGYSKGTIEFHRRKKFNDKFSLRGKTGLFYRSGFESFHVRYGYTNEGIIWERIIHSNSYEDIGLSLGVQAEYRLLGQLSAVVQANFLRYFSKYSPNELHNVFGLSYGF